MVRHSIQLYDTAVSHRLQSTLVASVESADGPLVQLALEQPARMPGDDGGGGGPPPPPPPPRYLAARLSSSSDAAAIGGGRPDKILVWDLARGVVGCTLAAPGPATAFRGLAVRGATLYALAVHGETGKVHVVEYDLAPEGNGRPTRKVKCPGLGADEAAAARLGLAVCTSSAGSSSGGSHEENVRLAVRLGGTLRILDGATGKKLAKCKVRGGGADDDNDRNGNGSAAPVLFSSDAALVATTTASGLQIFRVQEGGRPLGTVAGRGGRPVGDAALRPIGGGRYAVLTTEPAGGCAYLSEFGASGGGGGGGGGAGGAGGKKGGSKGGNIAPLSTIQCADDAKGVVAAAFHGASPGSRVVVVAMPGTGNNSVVAAVGSRGNVEVDEVDYRDEDGNMVRGDIVVGDADGMEEDMDGGDGAAATGGGGAKQTTTTKKRALPSGELVLGPGEAGGEALGVTDRATSKRARVVGGGGGGDDDDDDADDGDEFVLPDDDATEEAAGATIADRLALLTSEMERDADEDSDDDDGGSEEDEEAVAALYGSVAGGKGGKTKRRATSESLSTLLRQALSSNDDGQLEVALHVHDKKVIEHSIATLAREDEEADDGRDDDMITKLLGKLVDRLGRKPGRAEELSVWVQTVLLLLISGKSMSRREREVAAKLAPLRSMLNERVESLPHLLRLEGRLSLLGQQL